MAQLLAIQTLISPSLQQNHPQTASPLWSVKLATVRVLVRLRSHNALSPLAKLNPMHLQRRVKTSLAR